VSDIETTIRNSRPNATFAAQLDRYVRTLPGDATSYPPIGDFLDACTWFGRQSDPAVFVAAFETSLAGLSESDATRIVSTAMLQTRSALDYHSLLCGDVPGTLGPAVFGRIFGHHVSYATPRTRSKDRAAAEVDQWSNYLHSLIEAQCELSASTRALAHVLETDWHGTLRDLLRTASVLDSAPAGYLS
jgi:hypothetical protein